MRDTRGSITAIFPDGAIVVAGSWVELEDALRGDAWNPSRHEDFRREMALRARNWSRAQIREDKSSEAFMRALEAAGMLRLEATL